MTVAPVCLIVCRVYLAWAPNMRLLSVFVEVAERTGGQNISTEALPISTRGEALSASLLSRVWARALCALALVCRGQCARSHLVRRASHAVARVRGPLDLGWS